MAIRLIGTDDANPRLPAVVIQATQGTTAADLAPGDTLADANAYTDEAIADVIAGGVNFADIAETIAGTRDDLATTPAGVAVKDELYDVRRSGVTFDNTTDDTAALNAAFSVAGSAAGSGSTGHRGGVKFPYAAQAKCVGLIVPDRVIVEANGGRLNANGTGTMITLGLASELRDCTIVGGGATAVDGVLLNGYHSRVQDCFADNLGGPAFILNNNAAYLVDSFAQNCLLNADTLAAPTGVVDVRDTDCWIEGGEYTASRATLSTPGFAYALAFQTAGSASIAIGTICEVSDHGVYVAAAQTRLIGVRADLNRGHGFVFAGGSCQVVGCLALSNGRQAANTYDGFNVTGGVHVFSGNYAATAGNTHRYGFNDASNSGTNWCSYDSSNQTLGNGTALINVAAFAGSHVSCSDGPPLGITAAATTWNVQQSRWPHTRWFFQNTGPVSFTDFLGEIPGMRLTVWGDGQTTIVHNTSTIRTLTAANVLLANGSVYEFVSRNGVWYQV